MIKEEIYKAYETIKPDEADKERMLENILNAASDMKNTGKETNMGKWKKMHKLQLAAALALALIIPGTVAYATDFFGLRNISIGKTVIEEPGLEGREVDVISLQGMSESPEGKACAEWAEFCEEYDKDGAIIAEIGNGPTGLDPKYAEYNCYTQEMADKIDEICEKYQLSLLEGCEIADTYEQLCSNVGIGDVCGGATEGVHHSVNGGFSFEDGSFEFEGMAYIDGTNGCVTDYQFSRSVKGTFSSYSLNVGNIDNYKQWEYTTANGETVMLANSADKALIIVDKEESFVVVNVLGDIFAGTFDVSDEALEKLADSFDFSIVR